MKCVSITRGPLRSSNRAFSWRTMAAIPSLFACVFAGQVKAADPITSPAATPNSSSAGGYRYGLFGALDSRSQYGKGAFPEPFIVDDSDLEENELRLDWVHTEHRGQQANETTAEIEKGFGQVTLEVEFHYERNTARSFNFDTNRSQFDGEAGFGNIDLGARFPVYQFVSKDELIDSTFGVGIEVGIPTNTIVSKNTEVVPKVFNDLRIGDHFTLQTIVGLSFLLGGGDDGGSNTLEYGLDFGWTIPHSELPIPGVQQMIPIFEVSGETALNNGAFGQNTLLGNAAVRFNLNSIGRFQPRLGIGYIFPMDKGGRDDLRWGVVTSLVIEF
jgi:hypothetical protein